MTRKSEIGAYGEQIVAEELKAKGYRILERNYRKPWGELDIIAIAPDRMPVFVEVKTLQENENFTPEKSMSPAKLVKLRRMAQLYAGFHSEHMDDQMGWRIDLAAVTLFPDKKPEIRYYENI